MNQERPPIERALIEAVDEGLYMFGESGREVIYFRLRFSYALGKEDIPSHPEIFVECLRNIFGPGAKAIEKAIIKSLYKRLGLKFVESENFDFLKYLNEAKTQLKNAEGL